MDEQQPTIQSTTEPTEKPATEPTEKPATQFEKPKKTNFWSFAGWAVLVVVTAVIFFIFNKYCDLNPKWLLAVLMADYLVLLLINYIDWFKKARWIFGLFLALMPALLLFVTHPWSFWLWIAIIVLYLITLLQYFIKSLSANAWSVIIPLTLFLALMIFKLQKFLCIS